MCNTKIDREGNIPNQLWLLLDKVAGIFGEDECEYLTYLPTNICYDAELKYKKNGLKVQRDFHLSIYQFLCLMVMMSFLK